MKVAISKILGLTKNEVKIVNALDHVPKALHEIEMHTKISHTSVLDSLRRLTKRGIVDVVYGERRKTYICTIEDRLKNGDGDKKQIKEIEIYEGKENLLSLISNELIRHKNSRLLSFHGEQVAEGWLAILSPKDIQKRNELIIEHNIIVERFVPLSKYKNLFKKFPIDWQNTMVGRTHITYFLPDSYFDTKTELITLSVNNSHVTIYT